MSKKDVVAIEVVAAAFRVTMDEESGPGRLVLYAAIERVADVCAASNDSFDRTRFVRACGMSGN